MKSSPSMNIARIKVVGIGGGGCNAITRMVQAGIEGVEFIAMNTDAQALAIGEAPTKIQIGVKITRGLGAGGDPAVGAKAADESKEEIRQVVNGADMVFVTCGMGGGTGTGGAPVVAQMAKESGALTIGVVTRPFTFEGVPRRHSAEEGINRLSQHVDTLIIIPNDRLLALCDHKVLATESFKMADDALRQGVSSIAEIINVPGTINVDFADVRSVMKDAGPAWMSIGKAGGQNRAIDAAKNAIASPLLDVSIEGAKGVLFNVTGGENLTLHEVNEAAEVISKAVDPEAKIIFGVRFDPSMNNEVKIILIATGFTSRIGADTGPKDEDIRALLHNMQDESEMEIPSFIRSPLNMRRRQMLTRESIKTEAQAKPNMPARPNYSR